MAANRSAKALFLKNMVMKTRYFLPALLCLLAGQPSGAQTLTFQRTYGGHLYEDARAIAPTPDGGFVMTGLTLNGPDPDGDMYLTKINAAGAVVWKHHYGRPTEDGGNDLLPTSDGGYLIIGHTAFTYGVSCDGYLVKTDAEGYMQWYALIGTAYDDVCHAAIELEDGSFLVSGRIEDPFSRTFRIMLAHVSASGKVLFTRTLSTERAALAYHIGQAADGNVLLAGYTYDWDEQHSLGLLVKCTPEGQMLWARPVGDVPGCRLYRLLPTSDGGAIVVGGYAEQGRTPWRMVAARFDGQGQLQMQNLNVSAGAPGMLYDIAAAPTDGQIVVAGVWQSAPDQPRRPAVGSLDEQLTVGAWKTVDFPIACRTRSLAVLPDGDMALCGHTLPETDTPPRAFTAKLPALRSNAPARDIAALDHWLFPNPMREVTYLKVSSSGRNVLELWDLQGRLWRQITFKGPEVFLHRENLPAGAYYYAVRDAAGKRIASGQLQVR